MLRQRLTDSLQRPAAGESVAETGNRISYCTPRGCSDGAIMVVMTLRPRSGHLFYSQSPLHLKELGLVLEKAGVSRLRTCWHRRYQPVEECYMTPRVC